MKENRSSKRQTVDNGQNKLAFLSWNTKNFEKCVRRTLVESDQALTYAVRIEKACKCARIFFVLFL